MDSRWIPKDNGIRRNISGNDAAGADDGILSNRHFCQDRAPGADRSSLLYQGLLDLPIALGLELPGAGCGSRKSIVNKGHVVADKDVIFDGHAFAHKSVTGNLAAAANYRVLLDFDESADLGVVANVAAV